MAQALSNRDAHVDTGVGPVAWTPDSGEGPEKGAPGRVVRRNIRMSPTWSAPGGPARLPPAAQPTTRSASSWLMFPRFSGVGGAVHTSSSGAVVVMSSLSRRAFGSAFQAGNTVTWT